MRDIDSRHSVAEGSRQFKARFTRFQQADKYSTPWPLAIRLKGMLWRLVWLILFRPTPKPLSNWRNYVLRAFGARIEGAPFVSSSARIRMPWNLTLEDRACIGEDVDVYNLGPITLKRGCVVAQQVYLCTGSHDLSDPAAPLMVAPIQIGEQAFVGVRALILPGVMVGAGAVVGGGSVVARDVEDWTIVAGNPATAIGRRDQQTTTRQ
ncbi:Acetyltransferase [Thiocapsa sp. KS1]|nr:DapH/DapD/GlmU-related protein [Thiocapsa sp. KS1]CRI68128.1 Acetyltransferase [Thiocapsa sp. KS1]